MSTPETTGAAAAADGVQLVQFQKLGGAVRHARAAEAHGIIHREYEGDADDLVPRPGGRWVDPCGVRGLRGCPQYV